MFSGPPTRVRSGLVFNRLDMRQYETVSRAHLSRQAATSHPIPGTGADGRLARSAPPSAAEEEEEANPFPGFGDGDVYMFIMHIYQFLFSHLQKYLQAQ